MKKKIAVLGVLTRMSIYKIIMVMLFLGITQVAFVYLKIKQCIREGVAEQYIFVDYMDHKFLLVTFLISFLLINLILYWTYREQRGVCTAFLYKRTGFGRNQKFVLNMLYAWFCYFLLYGWQLAIGRIIEWMVRSMTIQEGTSLYQYVRGVEFTDLMRGIVGMDVIMLVTGLLFLGVMSMEVAKSEWLGRPPVGIILIFVWYAVTYVERSYSYWMCDVLTVGLLLLILYFILRSLKRWKQEKNTWENEERE